MPGSVLHFTFDGEYVLFSSLRLDSWFGFFLASLFATFVCFLERFVSALSEDPWALGHKPWHTALSRSVLFWIVTLLRLIYMIIAMGQNAALILVLATSLTAAQFIRELRKATRESRKQFSTYVEMDEERTPLSMPSTESMETTRPRSRSKPDELCIHPLQSNIARADATAFQLGFTGSTDDIRSARYERDEAPWQAGAGKDAAREAFLASGRRSGNDSDSESGSL